MSHLSVGTFPTAAQLYTADPGLHQDQRPTFRRSVALCRNPTHTNAGRAALEQRLRRSKVPSAAYRVATLDSWAMRLGQRFPMRSGLSNTVLRVERGGDDYRKIREATVGLLNAKHPDIALRATYSRVLVDEYQDCDMLRHALVVSLSNVLPVTVLGDPLQAIFDFNGPTVRWKSDVQTAFPPLGRLSRPWRWENASAPELGQWLLKVRRDLLDEEPIDLAAAPSEVVWIELSGNEDENHRQRMKAAQSKSPVHGGSVAVILDSSNKRASSMRQVERQAR
ncbi:UvrD-helicase domain-containing protein [Variovorax sp. S2]|nr:UvrD-helicase domain-containing protein [Variovorax sp. S12S4]MCR8960619.1 UvrD-helicase domain-containing protein [Variovorax sp. S12S4]